MQEFNAEMESPDVAVAELSPLLSGDPTQQLLTALGRFQRQVNVADSGAPSEAWVDNCIDQLIAGIQIAHVRGWKGVKEALTDTARVLQSYDEAGDASGCVAFLQDAYEILCLMVGDLIVDNFRSGVMDKWRERYLRAVADLEHLGYTVIDDNTGMAPPPVRVAAATPSVPPTNVTPFVPRAAVETPADEAPPALHDNYADVDTPDVTYGGDVEEDEEDYSDTTDYAYVAEADEPSPFGEPEAVVEWEEAVVVEEEVEVMEEELEEVVELAEEEVVEELLEEEVQVEEIESAELLVEVMDEEEADEEDSPFAGVVALEEELEAEPIEMMQMEEEELAVEVIEEQVEAEESWLVLPVEDEQEAEEAEAVAPAPPIETGEFLFDLGAVLEETAEAPVVDVTYVEQEEAVEPEAEPEVVEEAAPIIEVVEEVAPAAKPEESPESLLRSAQAAMMRGDVRDAKVLALQLASSMARQEAQKAVQIVQEAVNRLMETDQAIEVAGSDAAIAEQRLAETHGERTQREHEVDVKKAGIAGIEKRADKIETAVTRLDEQIAKLQAQREEELDRLAEAQAELEVEREQELMLLEDLDRLHESEQAAEATLELAWARVEQLRLQRLEREQAREACEQMLERQRESAEGIERTLDAVVGK
jgi:hypothetical protein